MRPIPIKIVGLLVLGHFLLVSVIGLKLFYQILIGLEIFYGKGF